MDCINKFLRKHNTRKNTAFNVWFERLLLIMSRVFVYDNLPSNLPQWELERRLILTGKALIFKNEAYGIMTADGATSGVNIYNYGNQFNYAQAVIGSQSGLEDNIDGVIMYGTSLDKVVGNSGVLGRRLNYYADILSDIDVSRQVALINNRAINTVAAKSDNALNALKEFYRRLMDGDVIIPKIQSGVLEATENILKQVTNNQGFGLLDYDTVQQNILKMFYTDIGIAYGESKRERMLTDEVTAEQDALDINLYDMLDCRQKGVNAINILYGTTIKVGVNNNVIT